MEHDRGCYRDLFLHSLQATSKLSCASTIVVLLKTGVVHSNTFDY